MPKLPEFDEDKSVWAWEEAITTGNSGNKG
jgi:hypothetical protein